ncbi:MAG: hypothetical protein KBF66_07410 [Rhodoferax sp.]|uniref:hypothetical protein n=1 Tax=Rhodoferax sp. TaxID=50421 RepID=UPI001B66CAE3|nr:hypothetical protein [Rhodoferax sp.]MBP9905370.1 hypothetical protein [Rhodoferax sp.]
MVTLSAMHHTPAQPVWRTLARVAVLLCASTAWAASALTLSEAQARYRQDLADCERPDARQDPANCRLEVQHALAEAQRGGFNHPPVDYQANVLRRCAVHQGDARTQCEARMRADSTIQGSVAGGGILRQSITVTPVPAQ